MTTHSDEAERAPAERAPAERVQPEQGVEIARTPREVGGREGPDPIRFGDWELRGRCIDF